jgi:hypothetical protein
LSNNNVSNQSNFDSKIKPVSNLNETGPINFSKDKNVPGKSDSGSGIAESIDNYDDDDFEVSYAQGSKVKNDFKNDFFKDEKKN